MTAPDHRPYLADTDLRTAEDVARWLREHAEQRSSVGGRVWRPCDPRP